MQALTPPPPKRFGDLDHVISLTLIISRYLVVSVRLSGKSRLYDVQQRRKGVYGYIDGSLYLDVLWVLYMCWTMVCWSGSWEERGILALKQRAWGIMSKVSLRSIESIGSKIGHQWIYGHKTLLFLLRTSTMHIYDSRPLHPTRKTNKGLACANIQFLYTPIPSPN